MVRGLLGTDHCMQYGTFNADSFLTELHSDEGADPVMFLSPMPSWWCLLYVDLFVRPN